MVVKWIVCNIKNNFKKEFSLAQEQWIETQNAIGFIGQAGGWDLDNKKTACIISFWENEKSLKLFMENIHDKIFSTNMQSDYFDSINIQYFNMLLEIESNSGSLIDALNNAKLLGIKDFKVNQKKIEPFEIVQKKICFPEMKKVKGMLGGYCSKAVIDSSGYLVSTFWDDIEDYKSYMEKELAGHKVNANIKNEIDQKTERQILLVDSWKIIKKSRE